MKRIKRIWALLLALALCTGLFGCGAQSAGPADEAGVGIYVCVRAEALGRELEPEELFPGGVRLELHSGGGGLIYMDSQEGRIQWTLAGETFSLSTGSGVSTGTLRDGVIVIDLQGSGTVLTFAAEGAEPIRENEETLRRWLGGWYGWWAVGESSGAYAMMRNRWFDCCAQVTYVGGGKLRMSLWDEEGSQDELIGSAVLLIDGEDGAAEGLSGVFLGLELQPGEWTADPDGVGYEDMLRITGRHEDADGGFDYEIVLRPWGRLWEDVKKAEPELLPYYYENWYLPLIDEEQDMPGQMELPNETPISETAEDLPEREA